MGLLGKLFGLKTPPAAAQQMGRNDTCWCGSGVKYKKCHYETDQRHFSRSLSAGQRNPAGRRA